MLVNGELMLNGPGLDEFYARISSSGVSSYLPDALGSTRLLADGNGNVTATYGYTPYGQASRSGSDETLFQFTGRENDGESRLYYYRARYYDPEIGRFLQIDPIGFEGGLNVYLYANGNPASFTDPLGLEPTEDRPRGRKGRQRGKHPKRRACNSIERAACQQRCVGRRGVKLCEVTQRWAPVRVRQPETGIAFILYKWKDLPMTCLCNDIDDDDDRPRTSCRAPAR